MKITNVFLAGLVVLPMMAASQFASAAEEITKLLAEDGAPMDFFGGDVAISGDTAVVGAHGHDNPSSNSGAAYVFVREGADWVLQQKLISNDNLANTAFGNAVSVSGDTIIVGARAERTDDIFTGAAFVFTREGDLWTQQQKLTANDTGAKDEFGYSVAIEGDSAIISARLNEDTGAAYVFVRSDEAGGNWVEQQKLVASDRGLKDNFGFRVSISEDTAVIGANTKDGSAERSGAAYVFVREGNGWVEEQKLTAPDSDENDRFGWSVSISGDTAIIGANQDDDNGENSGAAYVFTREDGEWTQEQKLTPDDAEERDYFGSQVAVQGDTVIASALLDGGGSAYVFSRDDGEWIESDKIVASDDENGEGSDRLGIGISVSENTLIMGAHRDDDLGNNSGSAYVFELGDSEAP